MSKPVTGQTTFGASTTGTTTQLDSNFLLAYNALNDLNTYANFLTDTGAANAYVVTLAANLTGALTNGLVIQMKATHANTGASTLNYNGTGAIAITDVGGAVLVAGAIPLNGIVQLQYSSGTGTWLLQTPLVSAAATGVQVPVRQTVLTGPINSSGLPTLLPLSCTSLTLNATNANATTPIVVAASNGFTTQGANDRVGSATANLTWSNLTANSINYLGVTVEANQTLTTVFTTVPPVYQFGGSATNGSGNYTFSTQQMQMQAGNGSATAQAFTVFVGEANCNGNAVISTVNYAYQGRYRSPTANCPSVGTRTNIGANIGTTMLRNVELWALNVSTDNGYTAGQIAQAFSVNTNSVPPVFIVDRNTLAIQTGATGASGLVLNSTTAGSSFVLTIADWNVYVTAERAF